MKNKLIILMIAMALLVMPFVFSLKLNLQNETTENIDDTYVRADLPDTSQESSTSLAVTDTGNAKRVYIRFNFSALPADATIDLAQLSLHASLTGGASYNMNVYYVNDTSLNEATTWNIQQCGTLFDDATKCNLTAESAVGGISGSEPIWHTWNVTDGLRRAQRQGLLNATFVIHVPTANSGNEFTHNSKEHATASFRPSFNIT